MNNIFFNFKTHSKKIILVDEDENLVLEQDLCKKMSEISKYLNKSSVIVLIADNCFEFIAGYAASLNLTNTVTILLDKSFSKNYLENIIKKFKPNYIFTPKNINFDNININGSQNF